MLLQSELRVVSQLYIHREGKAHKFTKERLENYVGNIVGIPSSVTLKVPDKSIPSTFHMCSQRIESKCLKEITLIINISF